VGEQKTMNFRPIKFKTGSDERLMVHTANIAYDLDFIILASLTIINGHAINEISLDVVNTTLYSPL
jgi:hypothetical protein